MVIARRIREFRRDEEGGALVEALIVMGVLLLMVAAFIELTVAVNQWNMGVKALQIGARTASVSHPVDRSLPAFEDTAEHDDPATPFGDRVCTWGSCTNGGEFDEAAMERILSRMQQVFPRIESEHLEVRYSYAALGYPRRPDGPVPLIQLKMSGVPFQFMLLGAFIGRDTLTMPEFTVSAVAENLSTCGTIPSMDCEL